MTFGRRLRFYVIGLSLGILVVAFMFGPRAFKCSYFPNARVLEEARTKPVNLEGNTQEMIEKHKLDSVFVYQKLLRHSKITNFNTEEMRSRPCRTYRTEYKEGTKVYKLKFRLCKDKTILDSLVVEE